EDGCGGLEVNAEEDRLPVANAALSTAGAISLSAQASFCHIEEIVVFGAFLLRSGESAADFESLRRGKREHRPRKFGFALIEDRFAHAGRHSARDAFDRSTDGVAFAADLLDELDHAFRCLGVRATYDVGFDLLELNRRGI